MLYGKVQATIARVLWENKVCTEGAILNLSQTKSLILEEGATYNLK